MTILLLAEHDNHSVTPATLSTVAAAQKIGGDIHILIAGKDCSAAANAAANISGVSKVLKAEHDTYAHSVAEGVAALLVNMGKEYSHILAPATTFGKNILPRAAALLDVQMISDVMTVHGSKSFDRPVYGGQAVATVETNDNLVVATIRATSFDAVAAEGGNAAIEDASAVTADKSASFVSLKESQSERPELTSANIVVSGGRALGSKENFELIEKLADKLGAAIGASRAAVDAGYVPNDYQVGQTGKTVAPDLYIAIGISGAIQHLAGMKDSKVIVAINKDEEAPIFGLADYGLVGDLFQAVPELIEKI